MLSKLNMRVTPNQLIAIEALSAERWGAKHAAHAGGAGKERASEERVEPLDPRGRLRRAAPPARLRGAVVRANLRRRWSIVPLEQAIPLVRGTSGGARAVGAALVARKLWSGTRPRYERGTKYQGRRAHSHAPGGCRGYACCWRRGRWPPRARDGGRVSANPSRVVRCVADTANDATAQTPRSR